MLSIGSLCSSPSLFLGARSLIERGLKATVTTVQRIAASVWNIPVVENSVGSSYNIPWSRSSVVYRPYHCVSSNGFYQFAKDRINSVAKSEEEVNGLLSDLRQGVAFRAMPRD